MRKLVLWSAGVAGLAIAGLCIYLLTLDLDAQREAVADAVERATGRKVELGAGLEVSWGWRPVLTARGLSLANPPWARSGSHLLKVGLARTEVDLLGLLAGRIDVHEVHWDQAEIWLEVSPDGTGNWEFGQSGRAEGTAGIGERLSLDRLKLTSSALNYIDATGAAHRVEIEQLSAAPAPAEGLAAVSASLKYQQVPMKLDGQLSSLAARPFKLDGTLAGAGFSLSLGGQAGRLSDLDELDAGFQLTVTDGTRLATLLALEGGIPAVDAGGRVTGKLEDLRLSDLQVAHGANTLAGELQVQRREERYWVGGALRSTNLQLDTSQPEEPGPRTGADDDRLIPDRQLPAIRPPAFDARVELQADNVDWLGEQWRQVKVVFRADRTGYGLNDFRAVALGSTARGTLSVEPQQAGLQLGLELKAPGLALEALERLTGSPETFIGTGDLEARLIASGATTRALAQSLDGTASLKLTGARADLRGLDTMVGGITGLLTAKGANGRWSELNCGALHLTLEDGTADTRLLLDSDQAVVTGRGTIDLGRERIAMTLNPEPKSVTLNLAVPVDVSGPLANPSLAPQSAATMRRLGGLVGSVLFPPAALLAFADAGGGNDPCLTQAATTASQGAARQTVETVRDGAVKAASSAGDTIEKGAREAGKAIGKGAQKAGKAVEGVVEELGKGLKGLFGN